MAVRPHPIKMVAAPLKNGFMTILVSEGNFVRGDTAVGCQFSMGKIHLFQWIEWFSSQIVSQMVPKINSHPVEYTCKVLSNHFC